MKILITGNAGYIGPIVVKHLRAAYPSAVIIGFDNGYFAHALVGGDVFPEFLLDSQSWGDIRSFPTQILRGVDIVVHLCAISNDPMGNRFEEVTSQINYKSTSNFIDLCKSSGVQNFIFASSCSIYGAAEELPRKESDTLNPLTAYARSKVGIEQKLEQSASKNFNATALRFSTACGMSVRLRLDLVLNDFVASAMSQGKITVMSDGSPWRPLVDVNDMARAIDWAIQGEHYKDKNFLAINIGSKEANYRVIDLAEKVAELIPGTLIAVNKNAAPDKRSYQVDFSLFEILAPNHQPIMSLSNTIEGLKNGLSKNGFNLSNFRESHLMRLKVLERQIAQELLNEDLRWLNRFQ